MFTITERNGKYYSKYHKVVTAIEGTSLVKYLKENTNTMVCHSIEDGAFTLCLDPTDVINE